MVSNCANPKCAKPLHYLREGKIFVFDVIVDSAGDASRRSRRMEHYWLCGVCSQTMVMEQSPEGVRVIPRSTPRLRGEISLRKSALFS